MTRRQSNKQWNDGVADRTAPKKKFEFKIPLEKFSPRFFGIKTVSFSLVIYWLTISAKYYPSLLVKVKDILKEKRREKFTKVVLFFQENAPAHRALATQKKLPYLGFQCLDHPLYSADLAPLEFHLFPGLKKTIETSPFLVRRGGHCCHADQVRRKNF